MPSMPKVDLFAAIRRDSHAGMSVRAIARKYRIGRGTVRSALASAWPQPRKPMPPRPSKLDRFKPVIDDILRADLDAPRKQRHTVKRIYDRLLDEHGMREVSYAVVRAYVADRKPKIRVEAGRGPANVFFPQTHRPGMEAEVDFGEVAINLRGELVTCMLFAFRRPIRRSCTGNWPSLASSYALVRPKPRMDAAVSTSVVMPSSRAASMVQTRSSEPACVCRSWSCIGLLMVMAFSRRLLGTVCRVVSGGR
jgi:transposase